MTRHPLVAIATVLFKNEQGSIGKKNGQNSRLSKCEQNILSKISHCKQSVEKKIQNPKNAERERKFAKEQMGEKPKKTVKLMDREGRRDQMLEQVTETTYQRTRTEQRGATGNDWDSSDSDIPQVEWRKVDTLTNERTRDNQHHHERNQ